MAGHTPWREIKHKYTAIDCVCTVEQVKAGMHNPDCEWCNAGFDCNPDLSDEYLDKWGVPDEE